MPSRADAPGAPEFAAGLAERLRIARQLVEPRQVDAARRVGIDPGTWFRYERGTRVVDPYALAKFCVQYDVDPRFLLLGDASSLRWPLSANLRLIPEAAPYLPEPQPEPAPPASQQSMRYGAAGTNRTTLPTRQP